MQVRLARERGALSVLPMGLRARVGVELTRGRVEAAGALHEELEAVTEATGSERLRYGGVVIAAWRGESAEVAAMVDAGLKGVTARGEGGGLTTMEWACAVLYNGVGRYEDALLSAERAAGQPAELGLASWALPELVEAAARSGRPERGCGALARLSDMAQATATDWALGLEARSRALLSEDGAADEHYRAAIAHLERTPVRVELGRAHLLYGEWLRRARRRSHARDHLRTAHDMLTSMGPTAFGARAARELRAAGEIARTPDVDARPGSPPRKHTSRSSRRTVSPTRRSAAGCSSAPAPSSTTCTSVREARHQLA